MAITIDPDLRDGWACSLVSSVEGYDTRHVGLEGEDDDVIHCPQVFAQTLQFNIAV